MAKYIYNTDPAAYADALKVTKVIGNYYLALRDIPQLIKEYVKGTKALDYGCGTANSTMILKELGLQVDAVDIEPKMIEKCKVRDPKGRYEVIKSGEIPAEGNKYDLVLASLVLPYASTKEEMVKIFKEIARILKPNGCFIAIVLSNEAYNKKWTSMDTSFRENENPYSGMPVKLLVNDSNLMVHHYYWTANDYREAFKQSGLNIVKEHPLFGKDNDGYDWVLEKKVAPHIAYVAQKIQNDK